MASNTEDPVVILPDGSTVLLGTAEDLPNPHAMVRTTRFVVLATGESYAISAAPAGRAWVPVDGALSEDERGLLLEVLYELETDGFSVVDPFDEDSPLFQGLVARGLLILEKQDDTRLEFSEVGRKVACQIYCDTVDQQNAIREEMKSQDMLPVETDEVDSTGLLHELFVMLDVAVEWCDTPSEEGPESVREAYAPAWILDLIRMTCGEDLERGPCLDPTCAPCDARARGRVLLRLLRDPTAVALVVAQPETLRRLVLDEHVKLTAQRSSRPEPTEQT